MTHTMQMREGDKLIMTTVSTEIEDVKIEWQDILDATEVVPDSDHWDPPWEESDGYEHEVVPDEYSAGNAVGAFIIGRSGIRGVGFRGPAMITTKEFENWGSTGTGASKQVEFEAHAAEVHRTLNQIRKWYEHGWQHYAIVCKLKGEITSVGGFLADSADDPYIKESIEEIAGQMVRLLEKQGYEVVGRPERKCIGNRTSFRLSVKAWKEEFKRRLNAQNWKGEVKVKRRP